jgi:hypothetical protein
MEGCLGIHWQKAQEEFYTKNNIKKSGESWAQLVIRRIWHIAWELWRNRNEKEHKDDQINEIHQLIQEVDAEVAIGQQGFHSLTHLFAEDEIARVRNATTGYIRSWLRNVRSRRRREERRDLASSEIRQMRNTMYQFLGIC